MYCARLVPLLEQVLENNTETVKIVFKNMPLRFHKFADPSARAALAAFKQGKFWEFHDKLFGVEKLSDEAINNAAVELDLDITQFNKDTYGKDGRSYAWWRLFKDIYYGKVKGFFRQKVIRSQESR